MKFTIKARIEQNVIVSQRKEQKDNSWVTEHNYDLVHWSKAHISALLVFSLLPFWPYCTMILLCKLSIKIQRIAGCRKAWCKWNSLVPCWGDCSHAQQCFVISANISMFRHSHWCWSAGINTLAQKSTDAGIWSKENPSYCESPAAHTNVCTCFCSRFCVRSLSKICLGAEPCLNTPWRYFSQNPKSTWQQI